MNAMQAAPLWSSVEVSEVLRVPAVGSWQARGVSIDTRTLVPGDLFVAIKGPNADGHEHIAAAFEKGAAAAIVEHADENIPERHPVLLVEETLCALEDLGRAARARTSARVVAVTGSVGKTGTKEALTLALGDQGRTHGSVGSFNNHWGVPLSLARMPADTRFGVFEIGMNHPGEIDPLTRMVRPHVAVIVTVEAVHMSFFPNVEAIAEAKAEIFRGVEAGGAAVLNRDNAHYAKLRQAAMAHGIREIMDFGSDAGSRVRLVGYELEADGSRIEAAVDEQRLRYRIGVPGLHWVMNSLAVIAAASLAGADLESAARKLGDFHAPKGRGRRETLVLHDGRSCHLVDDSYNASPASMRATFENLGRSRPGTGGRRIAVLGDMLELGADSPRFHAELAPELERAGVDLVFASGPDMAHLWDVLPDYIRGAWRETSHDLALDVVAAVRGGDVIVVKGSKASRMDLVVSALRTIADSEKD